METLVEEFKCFTSELQLSESITEVAELFLEEVAAVYIKLGQKINKKALFACAIFIAAQDSRSKESDSNEDDPQPEITVSQLLNKAGISIMDFFSVTCFLKTNHQLSEKVKQNFIALERKYLIVSALYDKFESMVNEIFCHNSDAVQSPSNSKEIQANTILKNHKVLCWMLFLVAKAKVLWHRQELLATFHLLLCCIGEIVRITPTFLLLPPFDNINGKNENSLAVLEFLSNHFKTKFEEVRDVHKGWLHVASELKAENQLPEIKELKKIYANLYAQSGDIDESLFLERDWHVLPPSSDNVTSPRKYQSMSVRRTLDTAEALNTILLYASDDLTESLKNCLKKCSIDAVSFIKDFLNQSKAVFIAEFVQAHEGSDESLAERRFKLATRFYYIMLDALLKKESDRLSPPGFTSFIQNKVFHKSLLACCLEVTLMSCGTMASIHLTPVDGGSYQAQGISFPWILKVFNLEPFIFFKIIESFIRSAPTITLQIINHLKLIEDKILDSLSWKSGSSVFTALSGNGCSPSCKAKFQSPGQSPNLWSPNKDMTQQSPSTPHTCHAVNLFLKKVCLLAYKRLEKLCNLLEIDQETLSNIWICVEHVVYNKPNLLKDRHLDQIIMCCIFGVCKVLEKPVLFKCIISCYNQLPNSCVSAYKQVLTQGKRDFIVYFHNKEFHDEMKNYIISQYGVKKGPTAASISVSPVVLSPLYSLPKNKNIFISTLPQSSPFKNPNEVFFQKPYTFGSLTQPSKTLKALNISQCVSSASKTTSDMTRGIKRLIFDSEENRSERLSPTLNSAKKFLKFN